MKVLMVLDHEFPADTRVENETQSLIDAGHEIHLACLTRKKRSPTEKYNNIYIHRLPVSFLVDKSSVAALTFPLYFMVWFKFLDSLCKHHKVDAIHIHDLPLAEVGRKLKEKNKIKLVVDLHENWPVLLQISTHTNTLLGRILSPNKLWVNYEKKTLHHADKIIVVVEEAKKRLIRIGIKEELIEVVSNTLNPSQFKISDEVSNPKYFTLYYAGGINRHRGLQTAIEAIPIIKQTIPNIRLRIAGSGSYKRILKLMTEKLGLNEYVTFLGHLSIDAVSENLFQADVAIIPHLKTDHTDSTIPHKLFQYMYANKPIIASNCSPIERIIKENTSGLIFSSGDSADFAEKVLMIFNGTVRIPKAQDIVQTKYRWANDADVLIKLYEKLA